MRLKIPMFLKKKKKKRTRRRAFAAGELNRLTASWGRSNASIDFDLRYQLTTLRGRSRDLSANNEYAKRFISQCKSNIVGSTGVMLQSKSLSSGGTLDKMNNDMIEAAWRSWSVRGQCDVTGKLSLPDLERLAIETVAKDGECLVRIVTGYDNDTGFSLQVIEADYLDEKLNKTLGNGNQIRLGVELDGWGKPAAYWLLDTHPGEMRSNTTRSSTRVPADEIIHIFNPLRPHQSRGVPWMHAAMISLNDLGGYREAAIIAARVGAAKMGFIISPDGEGYDGEGVDADGNTVTSAEPGMFEQLPEGTNFESWNPAYPHDQFESFNKATLRGISGGLGVTYHSFASDLEGVNFSSARAGLLDERDSWMVLQNWFIQNFHTQLYPKWLRHQLMFGGINLPVNKFDKFNNAKWQPRRWSWVDPLKDIQANELAVNQLLRSRSSVIREQGLDPDDVWAEIAEDERKMVELGIEVVSKDAPVEPAEPAEPPPAPEPDDKAMRSIAELTAKIERLTDRIEYTRDTKIDVTLPKPEERAEHPINVTVEAAEAPVVNVQNDVHVPRQDAPVVNVDNQVNVPAQPAPDVNVEVKNAVDVPEVNVTVEAAKEVDKAVQFKRDRDGKITGATIKE